MNEVESGIRDLYKNCPTREDAAVAITELLYDYGFDAQTDSRSFSDPARQDVEDVIVIKYGEGKTVSYVHRTLYDLGWTYTKSSIVYGAGNKLRVSYFHENGVYEEDSNVPL